VKRATLLILVLALASIPAPANAATRTPTITRTVTATATITPAPAAIRNANLRAGPGTNYPIVGAVGAGQALKIVARNVGSTWYQLAVGAWISATLVRNASAGVPVAKVIPTPPPPTIQPTTGAAIVEIRPTAAIVPPTAKPPPPPAQSCCKVCRSSQACGDSCISWGKVCHKGPGCACQG
jgi:uncharacterized protein YraI